MKKYLFGALALPLLFACSSDDLLEKKVVSNDQFAGIEKVDATFSMAEGSTTRMATDWALEEGDQYGFAWLGDGTVIPGDGRAYQNHPLIQKGNIFEPQTSIYVGDYFLYRPYDETVVDIENINFKSLETQTLSDGMGGDSWKALAAGTIIIGDKWTNVTKGGWTDLAGNTWDKAGIKEHYNIYAAIFSNQTGLDLSYVKNNVDFGGKAISGATDISYTYPAGSTIGAADIYKIEATLTGATQSFQYAPSAEPNGAAHDGNFWETQSDLATAFPGEFDFTLGGLGGAAFVTLEAEDENGVSTDKSDNKGWFWFNSLPEDGGAATSATTVNLDIETSYGVVNVNQPLANCAYAYEDPTGKSMGNPSYNPEWIKLAAADNTTVTPKEWNPALHNTFVNQYGNHKGKYALTVDFSTGTMSGMHIKNDTHLQKALKYYIASGKTENPVVLNLDGASASDKTFKLSKISIALLQTIGGKVLVTPCTTHNNPVKVIVTQDGQDAIGLADAKDVPALNNVFDTTNPVDVYLSKDCQWTWSDKIKTGAVVGELTVDAGVKSITNEGTLTVSANNVQLSTAAPLTNAAGATMNITQVTTVKNDLTNLGTINVPAGKELRAYGIEIKNDATALNVSGTINNAGAIGVTAGTGGQFNNYGLVNMTSNGAITLLSSNELNANAPANGPFMTPFVANTNVMGTVVLPEGNPTAIVSVANTNETGFIKYNWTGATYTHDTRNVKYNTLVVSNNIEFTGAPATEVQFIEFDGTLIQVVNPTAFTKLPNLRGVIVNAGKSIIIEKTNELVCSDGAYLGAGAAVYRGGIFTYGSTNNYFGTWSTDQILEY